jgi:hypothetical protein
MGLELAKRALKAPMPSAAPKPVVPVGARGRTHDAVDPADVDRADRLTTAEWMRRREAQVAERGTRH